MSDCSEADEDMKDMIERLGYRVLGPAADVARAHVVLDRERPDAGVLDLNLKGEAVTPLAERNWALGPVIDDRPVAVASRSVR